MRLKMKKEQTALRKQQLLEKLKVGAFVKNVWGCTMQRVSYYEIVSIDKNRISLKPALIQGDPSPNCATDEVTLLGSNPNGEIAAYATMRIGYLVQEGKSLRDSWSTYEFVNIGDTTTTWSD